MTKNIFTKYHYYFSSIANNKHFIFVSISFIFALVFSFTAQIATFRVLDLHEYGIFSVLYSLSAIISVIGTAGFDVSTLRFFPNLDVEQKSIFFKYSLKCTLFFTTLTSPIYFLICTIFYSIEINTALYAIIGCSIWSFIRVFSSLLRALGRFNTSLFIDRYCRDGLITIVGICAIFSGRPMSIVYILLVIVAGGALGMLIALPIFTIHAYRRIETKHVENNIWLVASMGLLLINVLEMTFSRIDIILCSYLSGPNTSALLNIISVISNIITIPTAALTIIIMPLISKNYESGQTIKLRTMLIYYTVINFGFGSMIALFIFIFPDVIFGFFGHEALKHAGQSNLFVVLSAKLFLTLFSAAAPLILMSGRVRGLIFSYLGVLVLKLVGMIYFVPIFGLVAGVWNMTAGMIILTLCQLFIAIRIFTDRTRQTLA